MNWKLGTLPAGSVITAARSLGFTAKLPNGDIVDYDLVSGDGQPAVCVTTTPANLPTSIEVRSISTDDDSL